MEYWGTGPPMRFEELKFDDKRKFRYELQDYHVWIFTSMRVLQEREFWRLDVAQVLIQMNLHQTAQS